MVFSAFAAKVSGISHHDTTVDVPLGAFDCSAVGYAGACASGGHLQFAEVIGTTTFPKQSGPIPDLSSLRGIGAPITSCAQRDGYHPHRKPTERSTCPAAASV